MSAQSTASEFDSDRQRHVLEETVRRVAGELGAELVVLGTRRYELPRLPGVVLRGAIANALAHRSYEAAGTAVRVEMRPSAVVVRSLSTASGAAQATGSAGRSDHPLVSSSARRNSPTSSLSPQKADPSATATYAPQPDWIAQKRSQFSIVSSRRGASSAPDNGEARSTTAREQSKIVDARLGGRLRPGCPEPLCTTDPLMA